MTITIFLTSYNRPERLRRAVDSLLAQTYRDWHCHLIDDGSSEDTKEVIQDCAGPQIEPWHAGPLTPADRSTSTRYAVNLNHFQSLAGDTDIIGHMCDNVEYAPDCLLNVAMFFAQAPDATAGYVRHRRLLWPSGEPFSVRGHPEYIPTKIGVPVQSPLYHLDHSQVFFRWPVDLRWSEAPEHRRIGDGIVFARHVEKHGPILPIPPYDVAQSTEWQD